MTTKEFANSLEMSVNHMCQLTGLSRQGLNEIVQGRSTKRSEKKRIAKHVLMEEVINKRYLELKQIYEKYEENMKTISNIFDGQSRNEN